MRLLRGSDERCVLHSFTACVCFDKVHSQVQKARVIGKENTWENKHAYSERRCDRNRCLAASQPISVAGREIEESASRFPSDRNRPDFSSPPAAACSSHPTPPTKKAPVQVPRNPTLSGSLLADIRAPDARAQEKAVRAMSSMAKGGVAQFLLGVTPSPAFAVPRTAVTGVLDGAGRFGAHMISVGGGVGQPADFCPGQGNLARIQRVISIC